jgi:hypothetical protein
MSGFVLFFLGGAFGIVLTSLFGINSYERGYKDGKKSGYREATYEFEKGEK